jgi:hypothetical protein
MMLQWYKLSRVKCREYSVNFLIKLFKDAVSTAVDMQLGRDGMFIMNENEGFAKRIPLPVSTDLPRESEENHEKLQSVYPTVRLNKWF